MGSSVSIDVYEVGILVGSFMAIVGVELSLFVVVGCEVGLALGFDDGERLGAGDLVGVDEGEPLGELVGGSVFKIQRFRRAFDNSSRLSACTGKTPSSLPGLLSIIHKADPLATLLSSPTPIANRSTFISVSAAISESYWVTAFALRQ